MSGKNRAFALAAATAALVGLSAPAAGAATLQGNPSGFNNDSILNLSGNQIPIAACNLGIPVDALLAQIPISALNFTALGALNSTQMNPSNQQTCAPSTTQGNTTTTNTNSGNASAPGMTTIQHIVVHGHHSFSSTTVTSPSSDTSGFNGDSILNVSNNQIPATICNVAVPVTATGIQVPVSVLNGVLGGSLNSTNVNPTNTQNCAPSASQNNSNTNNTNSNNGLGL